MVVGCLVCLRGVFVVVVWLRGAWGVRWPVSLRALWAVLLFVVRLWLWVRRVCAENQQQLSKVFCAK